ncbi:deoxyhypusine hydroxylase-like [Argonauta hians]
MAAIERMRNSNDSISQIAAVLRDQNQPLTERFRALFTLRNLGGKKAINAIAGTFSDPSALLKHELAYCLGQMQDDYAVSILTEVLEDENQEVIVRHEAGEALGAIGLLSSIKVLRKFEHSDITELANTCQLAIQRIRWLHGSDRHKKNLSKNPYNSIDPAPPAECQDLVKLEKMLLDETLPIYTRYRAMFSLRNMQTDEACLVLAKGFASSDILFRHEIAYVLGQLQNPISIKALMEVVEKLDEDPMVRHECAEALGALGTSECTEFLAKYLCDKERIVRESCMVALDISESADQFQYANTLGKVTSVSA